MNTDFDDIRPYYDEEIPAAMKRIVENGYFPSISSYIYPDRDISAVKKQLCGYRSSREFQHEVMYEVNNQIINRSIDSFTCHGIERLNPHDSYLFISNHRDIMLDSSLLQNVLVDNGFETCEITFGANLMMNQMVIDIGKSNKMFKVARPGGSIKDFYRMSLHLSEYIRYVITQKKESVWIAQRNGRTKDGNDATDQGLIKMFCLSEQNDKISALGNLHIVPVAVSYEWESCDILKTLELHESRFTKYIKKPGEDLNSIMTGIINHKGDVNIEICEPIRLEELTRFENLPSKDYHASVAALIDERIISSYYLHPTNFIAYDIMYGCSKFSDRYTPEQKKQFLKHMHELDRYDDTGHDGLIDIFLSIYANPVINKLKLQK